MGVPVAIQRVGVVGCGLMGTGIAEASAPSGLPVVVVDVNDAERMYAPPPLLARMVEAGLLGRKPGRGFFDYDG